MFMAFRGPQRIWEAMPHSAGLEVIALLGTTSAISAAVEVCVGAGWNSSVVGLLLKMEDVGEKDVLVGRRGGREEKDLE